MKKKNNNNNNNDRFKKNPIKKRSFLWVTLALFAFSIILHWIFAWYAYVDESRKDNQSLKLSDYFNMTMRDTMENWQSEFLQLIWQVAGLSFLYYVGSSQSRESDDRHEEMLRMIIRRTSTSEDEAERLLKDLEEKYPTK